MTETIPHRGWTLVIGYECDKEEFGKYTVGVNGVEMSALPEAPKTAAQVPQFCRSEEEKLYTDTIK